VVLTNPKRLLETILVVIRIGISGWRYKGWRGVFYPKDLAQRRELEYVSHHFDTIEINGTHYSLQTPASFLHWRDQTPDDFIFSVKGSRYITHLKRLKESETPLANFLASGLLALEQKLGPFLWQLPPNFKFDVDKLEKFFKLLPQTTKEAARMARKHDDRLKDEAWIEAVTNKRLRHCLEVRHESFLVPEFVTLLRRYNVALVFADTAGKWPYAEDLTSDFVYIRLHGDKKLYESGYGKEALEHWATRIKTWHGGGQVKDAKLISDSGANSNTPRDVFVYFDNDIKVRAPADAMALRELLGP